MTEMITLNFKDQIGNYGTFESKAVNTDKVSMIKYRLQDQTGFDPRLIELYYDKDSFMLGGVDKGNPGQGVKMQDEKPFNEYSRYAGIGDPIDYGLITIKTKTVFPVKFSRISDDGRTTYSEFTMNVDASDSFKIIKQKTQDQEGLDPEEIILELSNGIELKDDKILGDLDKSKFDYILESGIVIKNRARASAYRMTDTGPVGVAGGAAAGVGAGASGAAAGVGAGAGAAAGVGAGDGAGAGAGAGDGAGARASAYRMTDTGSAAVVSYRGGGRRRRRTKRRRTKRKGSKKRSRRTGRTRRRR